MAQASMPPPAWAPPQVWSHPAVQSPNFAPPNYSAPPPPPPPPPEPAAAPAAAPVGEVPAQLLRVLETVTTMCDHVIEYIEADRTERRLMIEALTTLARAMSEALPPPSTPIANTERLIGGSMEAGPAPVLDIREPETAVEVKCRFGDKWVDGFEIFEVTRVEEDVRYRLRRRIDGVVLPESFDAADIRHTETFEELTQTPQQQKYWSPL